jgi:hypothetical protein
LASLPEKEIDLAALDNAARTPLHCAAETGSPETVKELLDANSGIITVSADAEWTPVLSALYSENGPWAVEKLKIMMAPLLEAVNDKDNGGESATSAQSRSVPDERITKVKKALERTVGGDMSVLHVSVFVSIAGGDIERMKVIFNAWCKARFDVNVKDRDGKTALHWAADGGSVEAVKVLLEDKEVNIFELDSDGQSVVDYAVNSESPQVLKFLLVEWLKAGREIVLKEIADGTQQQGRSEFLDKTLLEAQAELASKGNKEPQATHT